MPSISSASVHLTLELSQVISSDKENSLEWAALTPLLSLDPERSVPLCSAVSRWRHDLLPRPEPPRATLVQAPWTPIARYRGSRAGAVVRAAPHNNGSGGTPIKHTLGCDGGKNEK